MNGTAGPSKGAWVELRLASAVAVVFQHQRRLLEQAIAPRGLDLNGFADLPTSPHSPRRVLRSRYPRPLVGTAAAWDCLDRIPLKYATQSYFTCGMTLERLVMLAGWYDELRHPAGIRLLYGSCPNKRATISLFHVARFPSSNSLLFETLPPSKKTSFYWNSVDNIDPTRRNSRQ